VNPLAAYGFLGLPLAMVALPVYVQAPAYYAGQLGLPLSLTGAVLFGARLFDTVQDPWLGRVIDRQHQHGGLGRLLWAAALVLALAFAGLWLPPWSGPGLALWLALMLVACYSAHSLVNIAYLAWGARLAERQLTRAAAWREGAGLLGVLLASAVPAWLLQQPHPRAEAGLAGFALSFALLLGIGLLLLLHVAPVWRRGREALAPDWRAPLADAAFRRLLLPYFLNAVSVSIPATLALFFINDRIVAPQWAGGFLSMYFLAGALGLPVWARLATRLGVATCWRLGMLVAVAAFVWAAWLGPGDAWAYLAVCVMAGLALGADLALPPVLLAQLIPPGGAPASYYGIWSLLGKLALALSGLTLPLLAVLGYRPGQVAAGGLALALVYAGLPCLFKLCALLALPRGVPAMAGEPR